MLSNLKFFLFPMLLLTSISCGKSDIKNTPPENPHSTSYNESQYKKTMQRSYAPRSMTIIIGNKKVQTLDSANLKLKDSNKSKNKGFFNSLFSSSNTSSTDNGSDDTTRSPLLGQGFNSNSEEYLTQCVSDSNVDVTFNGQQTTDPDQKTNMSYKDINHILYGHASGDLTLSIFNASGDFDYSSNAQNTENSITFTNYVNFDNNFVTLKIPTLTASAYSLINKDTKTVNPIANDVCGDKFVSGLTLGAKLMITVKISANTSIDAQNIKGKLDANVKDFGSISGYLTSMDDNTSKNKSISIYIKQIGGDESQLPLAIPSDALHCGLDDKESRDACIKTLKALVKYEKEQFIPSIQKIYDPSNIHGLAVISTKLSQYKKIPIQYHKNDNTEDYLILVSEKPIQPVLLNVIQSRDILSSWYGIERDNYVRASDVLSLKLSDYQTNLVQKIQKNALANMKSYAFAGDSCFKDIPNCVTNKESAVANAIQYDSSVMDFNPILPLFDISGTWFNSVTNNSLNIAQIESNTNALYNTNTNYTQHDFGSFVTNNTVKSDSQNIITSVISGNQSFCEFNKKVIYILNQNNNINSITVYERVLPNSCGVEETQCNLPGESLFNTNCIGSSYINGNQNNSYFSLKVTQ